ncbi:hypothetical protein GCM10008986_18280 [Salinibacillus aidingensis]|uniref:Uncharacterized protein n=2 Tax=Salinibacillus aidingensis TaxID=237684 RepID=A0ABN1B857_9BACI
MSMCWDITSEYSRQLAKIGQFAEDGANIMINQEWLERPPDAADRGEFIKHKNDEASA